MIKSIIFGINNIFAVFYFLIILRIFLSWIPNIQWFKQPWKLIYEVTEIYLGIFRKFIPPIGMIDISPIVAILALQLVQNIIIFGLSQLY